MSQNHGPLDERPLNPAFDEMRAKRAFKSAQAEFNDVGAEAAHIPPPPGGPLQPAEYRWEEGEAQVEVEDPDNLAEARAFGFQIGIWLALGLGICIGVVWLKWVVPALMKLPHH